MELLSRRQSRQSLAKFIDYMQLGVVPAAHHRLLIDHLEAVERREILKLMVWMPPGSAKSTYTSVFFPPWFMGRNPENTLLGISNTTDLAERFSRRARNIVATARFKNVFGFGCSEDSSAAGNWENEKGGEFFAAGVGTSIVGRRSDCGLIDDPIKSREEADSERTREKQWEWYLNDFWTRLKPGARQIVIQCMTGDTRILMADGSQKALRDIESGDVVASYEDGCLTSAKVLNWANQGSDCVFTIRTISGITVKANERHPFLIERNGVSEWVRVRDLRAGDRMLRAAEHGAASSVCYATSLRKPRAIACRTTTRRAGPMAIAPRRLMQFPGVLRTCAIVTVSTWLNTMSCWMRKAVCALSADSLLELMCGRIGTESSASIMTTQLERCEGYSATTAISQSDMVRLHKSCSPQLNTFRIIPDEIVSITPAGREDVFDIQIEQTENFIANGLISHNTRWHEDDLSGRILEREAAEWTVLKLPMLAIANDPLGRAPGERLWSDWFTEDMVRTAQMDVRAWNSLYQQDPAPDDGDYFKREMFTGYGEAPPVLHVYGASDYAVTEGGGDYTEHGIFGLDHQAGMYLLDWWRGQTASDVWIERQCDLIGQWSPLIWFGESGPIRRSIEPFLKKRMAERQAPCRLEWLPSIADKVVRARPFQARAAMGNVFVPDHAPWLPELMSQLMRFPAGKYDDGVDVCSLIGRGLEHIRPPEIKAPKKPEPRTHVRSTGDGLAWMA